MEGYNILILGALCCYVMYELTAGLYSIMSVPRSAGIFVSYSRTIH